jgi:hypothetical protein
MSIYVGQTIFICHTDGSIERASVYRINDDNSIIARPWSDFEDIVVDHKSVAAIGRPCWAHTEEI